jgi:hypothetical protein
MNPAEATNLLKRSLPLDARHQVHDGVTRIRFEDGRVIRVREYRVSIHWQGRFVRSFMAETMEDAVTRALAAFEAERPVIEAAQRIAKREALPPEPSAEQVTAANERSAT